MNNEREFQALLAHLEQDLDGFLGAAFTELATGRTLAAHCVLPAFDQSAISEAGRVALLAQTTVLASPVQSVEEILITTSEYYHLYQMVSSTVFISVTASRDKTNLASIRALTRLRAERIAVERAATASAKKQAALGAEAN